MLNNATHNLENIISSSLWSAYGDALGFITELTTVEGLKSRSNVTKVVSTLAWKRVIGGKFGVKVNLPAGTYSDDTQLRLSTSRSIRNNGEFDVEAFAKIELPVWLSYALGAGRGSKEAASSLSKSSINWFSNFYSSNNAKYIHGGGNGAAMRIQPHVWASKDLKNSNSYIEDVIKNTICTHGHARGIAGAVFHAMCLAQCLYKGRTLDPIEWEDICFEIPKIDDVVRADVDLQTFWLPTWERESNATLKMALEVVRDELLFDISIIKEILEVNLDGPKSSENIYTEIVSAINADKAETRGSATKTALLACVLSYLYQNESPENAIITAINLLSSDTDTIATMAGALLGAYNPRPKLGLLQDVDYIISESTRLYKISISESVNNFEYPDLLHWEPPKSSLDAVGLNIAGETVLAGIAKGEELEILVTSNKANESLFWLKLDFGQTVLCKRRKTLKILDVNVLPARKNDSVLKQENLLIPVKTNKDMNYDKKYTYSTIAEVKVKSIDQLTAEAINASFDPLLIGRHIIDIAGRADGIDMAIGYTAIITKAIKARGRAK